MLHICLKNEGSKQRRACKWRKWAIVASLLTVLLWQTALRGAGAAEEGVAVTMEAEGTGIWTVCLSRDLYGICGGRSMALLLKIYAPRGYTVAHVESAEGADGLVLTVGQSGGEAVTVLLDGIPSDVGNEGEPCSILRVICEETKGKNEHGWADPEAYPTVTAGKYGELAVYVMGKEGVEVIPLLFTPPEMIETSDGTSFPAEQETDGESAVETDLSSDPLGPWDTLDSEGKPSESSPAETVGSMDAQDPFENANGCFMGCRETAVREGYFSVQFLFSGEGKGTPVICVEGRGTLTLTVSFTETLRVRDGKSTVTYGGGWSLCSFSGLSSRERYRFFVDTGEGYAEAVYENGHFTGFEKQGKDLWKS